MSRAVALADRAALLALRLVIAANLLFFISFLIVATMAMSQARAEAKACGGHDMLADIARDNPALLAKIEAEAAATPNGKGLLWRIDKPGLAPSWLLGTMHMTDPRVTALTSEAQAAFDQSGTVVIETTEILDQSKMMAAMMAKPDLMMFTDSTTLTSLLSPTDAAVAEKALAERGIPLASVIKMKPWMLAAIVALPACEMARKAEGALVLDVKLAEEAKASGKTLEGLETVADQLGAMASLPMDFHLKGLVETLKLGDRMEDVVETMIVLYEREDTGMFWPLFRAVLPNDEDDKAGYAEFEETMVTTRNHNMVAHAVPILERGGAFVAVGALHLPGDEGLIALLRKQGFSVTEAD
jgi:hypothetical protein